MESGIIFDIQNLSLHDGPGLRTTVFFKGCPLRCLWCANPESQSSQPEMMYYSDKCVHCMACKEVCPTGAVFTRKGCIGCGKCMEVCMYCARKLVGKSMTSDQVMEEIRKDSMLYKESDGGVTFSGGEVLRQPMFLLEIIKQCKHERIHTLLDTTAYCSQEIFNEVLKYIDLVYVDLKCASDSEHKKMTGVSNSNILKNIQFMDKIGKAFEIRMPIIPGYNDSMQILETDIRFIKTLETKPKVWLLPFHAFGKTKYETLGMKWPMGDKKNMDRDELKTIANFFVEHGIDTKIQ